MSDDPKQEYFSDGISEDILNGLAKNPGQMPLQAPRLSSSRKKGQDVRKIGEQLNVSHIVEGSVRKSGNRIRVTAQLVTTKKGTHLWSEQYDRDLTDVFEIQDEISAEILGELEIRFPSSGEKSIRTTSMVAYDAYLLGRYHSYRSELDRAVASFEEAVDLDPDYADAYGMLAQTHNDYVLWDRYPIRQKLLDIRTYIARALSLDPNQTDALMVEQLMRFFVDRRYQEAIDGMNKLVKEYPNNEKLLFTYGQIYQAIGRYDRALRVLDQAAEVDPLSPGVHLFRSNIFRFTGRLDEAKRSYEMAEALGLPSPGHMALIALDEGNIQGIQKQLGRSRSEWHKMSDHYGIFEAAIPYLEGNRDKAIGMLAPLKKQKRYVSPFSHIGVLLIKGDVDLALDSYAQATADSPYTTLRLIRNPLLFYRLFPDYRSHPKYRKMLRDVGLDEESIAKLKIPPLPF